MNTRLIIGLGNPGKRYETTRHNIGFRVADALADHAKASFEAHSRIPAMVAEWKERDIHWRILKPVTFMNLSGQAVAAAINFWKLERDALLVIADDVELAPGTLRLRTRGSSGGHNGLRSIQEHLATTGFARLRLGIGRPPRLPGVVLSDWVLQTFEKSELPWVQESINKAVRAIESWAVDGPAVAMNIYNAAPVPEEKPPETKPPGKQAT